MGGALDSARFKYRLSEALNCPASDVEGLVIWSTFRCWNDTIG